MSLGRLCLIAVTLLVSVACGDKVPESEGAKNLGAAPKQTVDKVVTDVGKAMDQGAERTRSADEGKN